MHRHPLDASNCVTPERVIIHRRGQCATGLTDSCGASPGKDTDARVHFSLSTTENVGCNKVTLVPPGVPEIALTSVAPGTYQPRSKAKLTWRGHGADPQAAEP